MKYWDVYKELGKRANRWGWNDGSGRPLPGITALEVGMVDFIKDVLQASPEEYLLLWEDVMSSFELDSQGVLIYTSRIPDYFGSGDLCYWRAATEVYFPYLCSDGRIRCKDTEEHESFFMAWKEVYFEEMYAGWYAGLMKGKGYVYHEIKGIWVNPETGDIITR